MGVRTCALPSYGLEADLVAIAATTALRDALQARFDAHAKQYPPPGGRQNLFALAAGEAAGPLPAGLVTAAALVLEQGTGTTAAPGGWIRRAHRRGRLGQ